MSEKTLSNIRHKIVMQANQAKHDDAVIAMKLREILAFTDAEHAWFRKPIKGV